MNYYEITANKDLGLVYCDNIVDNGRVYRALADEIRGKHLGLITEDVFPIQLIYNKQHVMVAEYIFVFNRIYHTIELETINMNQTAIDSIIDKEGTYVYPDENVISKELAIRMYNKFREILPCK